MKKNFFYIVIILITSFQTLTKANEISELEIDGFSIGDKLIDFISEKKIKKNIQQYFEDERNYYVVYYDYNLKNYDDLEIYLKTNDKNFFIKSINAGLYPKNLKSCLEKKDELVKSISKDLGVNFKDYSFNHSFYKNSKTYSSEVRINGGTISIECLFWDKKDKVLYPLLVDNLAVHLMSDEIEAWIENGYR